MHNNFYFLKQLTAVLPDVLQGSAVSECFSQSRDELILRFEKPSNEFIIKVSLQPQFCCLSFPDHFDRARRNSVDLFSEVIGKRVTGIRQFLNERSFLIRLSGSFGILFKMHGNRSNLLLLKENTVSDRFRKNIREDAALNAETLDRVIDWSFENFTRNSGRLKELYFTFGNIVWRYIEENNLLHPDPKKQWQAIINVKDRLEDAHHFFTMYTDDVPALSLLATGDIRSTFTDPVSALNAFFPEFTRAMTLKKEKNRALTALQTRLSGITRHTQATRKRIVEIGEENQYRLWADLIMANLGSISQGQTNVTLPDLYDPSRLVRIKLKADRSPQKNAELYYSKSRNQEIEVQHLKRLLHEREKEIERIRASLEELHATTNLKGVRRHAKNTGIGTEQKKQSKPLPYREYTFMGFKIWIGKNASANDQLTTKYTFKEDLWLHARDVAGSHVVIKKQSGKEFPHPVIERAAQLAAFYSKRKNESLCPVIFTARKFVRKPKGAPAGVVTVEREEVIMVEPAA